jgi:hypothetical protein
MARAIRSVAQVDSCCVFYSNLNDMTIVFIDQCINHRYESVGFGRL